MDVLVTGADQRQGLAVIQSLGRHGISVVAAGPSNVCLGFHSRYAKARWVYPPPLEKPQEFVQSLVDAIQRFRVNLVMPAVESTLIVLNEHRERIESFTPLAMASRAAVELSLDKREQFTLAEKNNIPIPKTIFPTSIEAALKEIENLHFPVVLKPNRKPWNAGDNWDAFKVSFVESRQQLKDHLEVYYHHRLLPIVQELCIGNGIGLGVLMDHGQAACCYQYHRGREYLPTGGVPVRYESMAVWPHVKDYSVRLLQAMNWTGVAQVEWKNVPGTQEVFLMEVNGRFWASLPGAIHAGMDFPVWQYEQWAGKPSDNPHMYREGIASRYLRGDLSRLEYRLRHHHTLSSVPLPSKRRELIEFILDFFRWRVKSDVFAWDDPVPGLKEAYNLSLQLLERFKGRIHRFDLGHREKSNVL